MKISKRYLVWANLVLLALVAYFGAATVTGTIAARLTPPVNVTLHEAPPPLVREQNRPEAHYSVISQRDIFNPAKPPVVEKLEPAKPTELRLKLWGVVVHRDDLEGSYAVIEDLTTRRQDLYRVNQMVASAATIKRVEWDKVFLDRNGLEEVLTLEQPSAIPGTSGLAAAAGGIQPASVAPAPGMPNRAAGRPASPGSPPPPAPMTDENSTIRQLGEGQYEVDQSEVNAALDNMNQLFTQVRAVPHFQGGKSTGFRLFAIRQNSIFDRLGLRNGDIIHSVNGNDISDPGQALAMLPQLRSQRQLTVNYTRNKEDKTSTYNFK